MPPKKGKKAASESLEDGGGPLSTEAQAKLYQAQVSALQLRLADKSQEADLVNIEKRDIGSKLINAEKTIDNERKLTMDISVDMTRQYKSMQEELLNRINQLENSVLSLQDEMERSKAVHERKLKEKDDIISRKDGDIQDLKKSIGDMTEEFSDMLRETLERMNEKIELSTTIGSSNASASQPLSSAHSNATEFNL